MSGPVATIHGTIRSHGRSLSGRREFIAPMHLKHICEVCGVEEILTPETGFEAGWDYPPKMGAFGCYR